jgi:hypothetical protein
VLIARALLWWVAAQSAAGDAAPAPVAPAPAAAPLAEPATTQATAPHLETGPVLRTRLVYVPGVFASMCPSEADVRARTVAGLGIDPFLEPVERTAILVVEGEAGDDTVTPPVLPRVVRVRLELVDADYESLGARTLDGDDRCDELVAAATLALAIALDPSRALVPPPSVVVAPARPFASAPRVIVRSAPAQADALAEILPEGTRAAVLVGGHTGLLLTPGLQSGTHLGATWRGSWWSLGGALRTDVPAGSPTGAMLVTLAPCAHLPLANLRADDVLGLKGCATATTGAAWALTSGGGGGPYLGAGARVGAEWVMADASAIGLWAQLEWGLVRPGYEGGISAAGTVGSPVNLVFGASFELGWPL